MKSTSLILTRHIVTPLGEMIIGEFDGKVCLCDWAAASHRRMIDNRLQHFLKARYTTVAKGESEVIDLVEKQVDEFLHGLRRSFDVPTLIIGTDFQKDVWQKIIDIPYGTTITYTELTDRITDMPGIRAVAGATGANALSLFIPCHRVIGAHGKLIGYAGGLDAKRRLLLLEKGTPLSESTEHDTPLI